MEDQVVKNSLEWKKERSPDQSEQYSADKKHKRGVISAYR